MEESPPAIPLHPSRVRCRLRRSLEYGSTARERDESIFAHPALARLAIEQHAEDLRTGRIEVNEGVPISGAEWRLYREGLGMSPTEFSQAFDAHVSTISDWEGDVAVFQHGNMARLAVRRLYALKGIPFPVVNIKRVRILC